MRELEEEREEQSPFCLKLIDSICSSLWAEYTVWFVILVNALWVMIEVSIGRTAFGMLDGIIPSILVIPLLLELVLRFVHASIHTPKGGSSLGTIEIGDTSWTQRILCGPCILGCHGYEALREVCAYSCCMELWAFETCGVMLELASNSAPLVVLDYLAIVTFLFDRTVLPNMMHSNGLLSFVHGLSSTLQLLRLLRPWAVGAQQWAALGCLGPCGHIGLSAALWLTAEPDLKKHEADGDIEAHGRKRGSGQK